MLSKYLEVKLGLVSEPILSLALRPFHPSVYLQCNVGEGLVTLSHAVTSYLGIWRQGKYPNSISCLGVDGSVKILEA